MIFSTSYQLLLISDHQIPLLNDGSPTKYSAKSQLSQWCGFFQKIIKYYADYRDTHELNRAIKVFNVSIKYQIFVFTGLLLISWVIMLIFEVVTLSFGSRFESLSIIVLIPIAGYAIYIKIIKGSKPSVYGKKEEKYAKVVGKHHHEERKKELTDGEAVRRYREKTSTKGAK